MDFVEWFFSGLGTFLLGLLVGGGSGAIVGWKIAVQKTNQSQRPRNGSDQTQAGRDIGLRGDRDDGR